MSSRQLETRKQGLQGFYGSTHSYRCRWPFKNCVPMLYSANAVGVRYYLSRHSFQWMIKYPLNTSPESSYNIVTGVLYITCSHRCSFIRRLYSGYWQYPLSVMGPCHCQPTQSPGYHSVHTRKTYSETQAAPCKLQLYPFYWEHLQQTPVPAFGYNY